MVYFSPVSASEKAVPTLSLSKTAGARGPDCATEGAQSPARPEKQKVVKTIFEPHKVLL